MIGTKLAHYEITAHLGSGGMGDVYQATDLKLKRSVAVKILPAEFASDSERLSRFRREAQLLASLNHPNIAHIYGLEEAGDKRCIVMELVEGETLQARIKKGPIPIDEALPIAKQICEALEAAQEKGVIHRDLKPGNVMLTLDGKVKVLDFGLAKAFEQDGSSADLSNSPTMMSGGSIPGVILGTAAYMSPEQAKGRTVDKRTDIFAFGCVLYEMLTGERAFDGEDVSEILSAVIRGEPDWTLLPVDVPPSVKKLLKLCLEKNVKNRRSDASDVRIDIEQTLKTPENTSPLPAMPPRSARLVLVAAVLMAIAAASFATLYFRRETDSAIRQRLRVSLNLPEGVELSRALSISPDGSKVAFSAMDRSGANALWVRPLNSPDAKRLEELGSGDTQTFWSPDGAWLAFFSDGKLKKIAAEGGASQILADAPVSRGGTWNRDGVILFVPGPGPLVRIPASGGLLTPLPQTAPLVPYWPYFLPDGDHFLFWSVKEKILCIGSLGSDRIEKIPSIHSMAVYSPPGYLLFDEHNRLMAQGFDLKAREVSGDPIPLADGVAMYIGTGLSYFSVSANGVIAFMEGPDLNMAQLTWLDRSGQQVGVIGKPDTIADFSLSPDEQRVAVDRVDPITGVRDIWLIDDLASGIPNRFTTAKGGAPIWSPDGKTILFSFLREDTTFAVYRKEASGNTTEEIVKGAQFRLGSWSPDGSYVIGQAQEAKTTTGFDLQLVPMIGNEPPSWFLKTPFNEGQPRISPNGKWVAYVSDESGRQEIYAQSFPKPGNKRRISNDGGFWPRWRRDGKELFYVGANRTVMTVPVESGDTLSVATPKPLFQVPIIFAGTIGLVDPFEVSADGQRFLVLPSPVSTSISLIFNWPPGPKK